ncbi:MFS transporter [Kroppenstedtia pulmonis]|uniref:MFS transporter n=1 Tax=Kroppenstedtia pulmonis TaxID=1380685 RepID=A0A7D3XZT5_9BACL|nr:MFS transporter [Kroppenstedtia pulmonis]QKG83880.1 MFS transporter [Kroppenstedtia pulmonis]
MQNSTSIPFKPSPKDFNLMVVGQIISILGSSLLRFALSLYVLDITGRADIYATLYAISNIPLLLAPLGGAIADRFNRRNLMVIFDFTSGVIVLCYFLFMMAGNSSVVLIGLVMVLLSIISAMYTPAVTASIPLLVEEKKLESANGLVQAVQALSGVIAPVMGGVVYGFMGVRALIVISCVAFFLSAMMEIFIKIPFVKREQKGHIIPTIVTDMKEGFTYVVMQPFILKSMVLGVLLNLLLTPYFVVGGPIILRVTMQSSESMYGVGMGLINTATILGALTIGMFTKKLNIRTLYRWLLVIALLLIPMALSVTPIILGLGYYPSFLLFILCAIPIAMALTIVSIFVITKIQKRTPNENLGKVMAIITAISQCAAPIGQVVYGFAFEVFSVSMYLPTLFLCIAMLALSAVTKKIMRNEGI